MIGRLRRYPLVRALAALRPGAGRTALAVLTGTGALASGIALMGVAGWLISRAAQQPPVLYLMVAVVTVRALGVGRGLLRYTERVLSHDVALRGVVSLRETVFARLAAEPEVTTQLRRGDLLARLGSDVDSIGDVLVRSVLPFGVAALTSGLSVLALALVLPSAALVLGVALVLAGLAAPALVGRGAARAVRDIAAARTRMSEDVLALLDSLPELALAGLTGDRIAHLEQTEDELTTGLDRSARPAAAGAALASAALGTGLLGCLVLGVQAVSDGRLAPVMLAVVVLVPLAVAEAVTGLPAAAAGLVRAAAAARRVAAFLDLDVGPHPEPELVRSTGHSAALPGRVKAHALACGYPGHPAVLTSIELDVAPGRHVAVVGASGSGKSTLLRTLAGLIRPLAGELTTDGGIVRFTDAPQVGRRPDLQLISEDAHVFTTTVRENLRLADPGAEDRAFLEALTRARLGQWLAGLPAGLDTVISDPTGPGAGVGGRPVSGGERRRLFLARALLARPRVLLVDEPAEHLDPATADALVGELLALPTTVFLVTHRLSPLAAADEVLLVADGLIAARGRHDDLMADSLPYREAWTQEQCPRPVLVGAVGPDG